MESGMDFRQFACMNKRRCEAENGFNHSLDSWNISDWMVALTGEVGEAANIVKKLNRIRDGIRNKEDEQSLRSNLRKELGDVFCYLDLMAQHLGFNIGDAALEVFNAKSVEIGYIDLQR